MLWLMGYGRRENRLAGGVCIWVVVGSNTSVNTMKLFSLCYKTWQMHKYTDCVGATSDYRGQRRRCYMEWRNAVLLD